MGVFVEPGEFIPSLTRAYPNQPCPMDSVRFLSDHIARLVAQKCEDSQKDRMMWKDFSKLMNRSVVSYGLMTPTKAHLASGTDEWHCKNWSYYQGVVHKTDSDEPHTMPPRLNNSDRIDAPTFPTCDHVVKFSGQYLEADVSQLHEKTLYQSAVHEKELFHALLVCHPCDGMPGVVYVFDASSGREPYHSVPYSTIKTAMDKLKFHDNQNYRMCYVYCSDASSENRLQCKFWVDKYDKLDAEQLQQLLSKLDVRIARVRFYPQVPVVEV